tara:strand:+ start:1023 stop:5060 length:4038 start_codon:yes stop_codon:yes gene_type:complete
MANPLPISNQLEKAYHDLLSVYRGIIDFEIAYDALLGESTDANLAYQEYEEKIAEKYPEVNDQVAARTLTGPPKGVVLATDEEGDQLGGTYYRAIYTDFKTIGLVTGINVRFLPQLRVNPPDVSDDDVKESLQLRTTAVWDKTFMERDHKDNSLFPGPATFTRSSTATPPKTPKAPLHIKFSPDDDSTKVGDNNERKLKPDEVLYWLSPPILRFLIYAGARGTFSGKSMAQNTYLQLAIALYKLLAKQTLYADGATSGGGQNGAAASQLYRFIAILETNKVKPIHLLDAEARSDSGAFARAALHIDPDDDFGNFQALDFFPGNAAGRDSVPGLSPSRSTLLNMGIVDGDAVTDTKRRFKTFALSANGYYEGITNPGNQMQVIDQLIRKLLVTDLKVDQSVLDKRIEARKQQILGFFGIGGATSSESNIANAESASDAGILRKLHPAKHSLSPIDFQCFLMENIRKLSAAHQSDYKNIIKLNTNGQPGLVQNKLSAILSTSEARQILALCPNVQALLTPYLRISRVSYIDGKATGKELPLDIPNFITEDDVSRILERGRLPGAGIKSFTWSLDGVQPAEVDNNISATLEMYFQTVNDFFNAPHAGVTDRASYLDLVIASPSTGKNKKKGEDASKKDPPVCTQKTYTPYKGDEYRIKVVAGWSSPGIEALRRVLADDAAGSDFASISRAATKLNRAIAKSRTTLYLQQTRHEFRFNQDGSLNLSVDYQASLSGIATSPSANILEATSLEQQEHIEDLEDHAETLKDDGDADEAQRAEYKEALDNVKKAKGQDKLVKYKKLLSRLFKSSKVYNLAINPQELLLPPYSELTAEGRARRAKRRQSLSEDLQIHEGIGNQNNTLLDSVAGAIEEGATTAEASENFSADLQTKYDALQNNPDIIWISYFYLGDLLDMVLEQIKLNHDLQEIPFKFFLSEVEMIDPLVALKIKNIEELTKCGEDITSAAFQRAVLNLFPADFSQGAGVTQLMNIGDVPISIDAFQVWFKNYVVKKDRDKYFFLHFVKDICSELITRSLSSACFGPDVKFVQRFDVQPLAFKMGPKGRQNLIPNTRVPAWSPARTSSRYSLVQSIRALTPFTRPKDSELGMVLLSTDSKPKSFFGDFEDDLRRNVYHNTVGSPCGLIKTINFSRFEQPYLREAKIQREGTLGPEQLRELYSADLELYGNTLYKNGNYVYLSPVRIGASDENLRILGLNGYYLITGVSSTVTESSFNVSVQALHEGVEFKDEVLVQPDSYDSLEPEKTPYLSLNTQAAMAEVGQDPPTASGGPTTALEQELIDTEDQVAELRAQEAEWAQALIKLFEEGTITYEDYISQLQHNPYSTAIADLEAQ